MKQLKGMKFVVADKGYDSTRNREFVKSMNAKPVIPYREFYGIMKVANGKLDKKTYHQRSIVETVFSVIKRKFGDYTYSKNYANMRKEMFLNAITYNVYLDSRALVIRVFYRALDVIIRIIALCNHMLKHVVCLFCLNFLNPHLYPCAKAHGFRRFKNKAYKLILIGF